MSRQSEAFSQQQATRAFLTLDILGLESWDAEEVKNLQKKIKTTADGWFGSKSIKAWKDWARKNQPNRVPGETRPEDIGTVIVNGVGHKPPEGVRVVNHLEEDGGVPAQLEDTAPRTIPAYQLVLHRGAQKKARNESNFAQATERVLDAKGCSTTFTLDPDGTFYQHFDPGVRRGRHCVSHNEQSDAIDIGGPFVRTISALPGQEPLDLMMAIGRSEDHLPPMKRKAGKVKCWTMTPEQRRALAAFLPWYCKLRGIPAEACDDWRTFRLSGDLRAKDPVTTGVKGIIAHCHVANPGSRVDGILPLHHLKEDGADIKWRSGGDFFNNED